MFFKQDYFFSLWEVFYLLWAINIESALNGSRPSQPVSCLTQTVIHDLPKHLSTTFYRGGGGLRTLVQNNFNQRTQTNFGIKILKNVLGFIFFGKFLFIGVMPHCRKNLYCYCIVIYSVNHAVFLVNSSTPLAFKFVF